MRIHRFLALLAILVLAGACDDSPSEPGDTLLPLETVVQSSVSGFSSPLRLAIRSEGEWIQVWATLTAGENPPPSRPAIDFDRDMAVLAAGGPGDGCFTVEVDHATRKADGSLEVEVVEFEAGPTCACLAFVAQPAHVVKLEKVDGEVRFVVHRQQLAC